jgi:hypothetical protein
MGIPARYQSDTVLRSIKLASSERLSDCALGRIRTCDTRFRKPMLYPLSYEGGAGRRHQTTASVAIGR